MKALAASSTNGGMGLSAQNRLTMHKRDVSLLHLLVRFREREFLDDRSDTLNESRYRRFRKQRGLHWLSHKHQSGLHTYVRLQHVPVSWQIFCYLTAIYSY